MRSKKQPRPLFPSMHRVLLLLASKHPLVIVTTPAAESYPTRGSRSR